MGINPRAAVARAEADSEAAAAFWQPQPPDAEAPPSQRQAPLRPAEQESLPAMSVGELRAFIAKAGLTYDDCLEKHELQARAREAAARMPVNSPEPAPVGSGGVAEARAEAAQRAAGCVPCAPAPAPANDGKRATGAGAAPTNAARAAAPPAAAPRNGAVKLRRGHITPAFWREESSWRNACMWNLVMNVRALVMLGAGIYTLKLVYSTDDTVPNHWTDDQGRSLPVPNHCNRLSHWLVVGAVSIAFGGALAPFTWYRLRATKLERGVGTAKRLREKGFGRTRMSRSEDNAARHRGCLERWTSCISFPVTACFIGAQILGFSTDTETCPPSIQDASTLFICSLYFLVAFQCVCIQSVQCTLWKELDQTMADDDDEDTHEQRIRINSGKAPTSPPHRRGGEWAPPPRGEP